MRHPLIPATVACALLLSACAADPAPDLGLTATTAPVTQPTPDEPASVAPTPSPSATPTATASASPTPTPTPTPSPTPTAADPGAGPYTEEGAIAAASARRQAKPDCDDGGFVDDLHGVVGEQDGRMLVLMVCFLGAYQSSGEVFAYDGLPIELDVEQWIGGNLESSVDVVGGVDEGADGTFTNLQRYRGLGDCGLFQTWTWSGERLILREAREQQCSDGGSPTPVQDWPVVYAAG